MGKFVGKLLEETSKIWHLVLPTMLTSVLQFSIGFVTIAFVGHLGTAELAAVTIAKNIIEGLAYAVLLGMGSALETLCGQAVGAGQFHMLGIYMQRSWIISLATAVALSPLYALASPILQAFHQPKATAELSARYCTWFIPQLFAYAFNFPLQKFFQSQSKVWVMTVISAIGLAVHAMLNWVLIVKIGMGILGAAIAGNVSWWLINLAQLVYLVGGFFPEAWKGFSAKAFHSLGAFVKLSITSAIMLCLEVWYYTALIIMVGCLKNPEIQVDAISICFNYQLWALMISLGFCAAVSVRISNELGAGHPQAAKFSVVIAVSTSLFIGILFSAMVLALRTRLPRLFTDVPVVVKETSKLAYLLAATVVLNSVQPVLSGVAIGGGWQALVAFVNIGCYYIVGLPIGAVLRFKFNLNALGIWTGMLGGTVLQTIILIVITLRINWQKEAASAEERVMTWGGQSSL